MEIPDASTISEGQREALQELDRIEATVPGAVRVRDMTIPAEIGGEVRLEVELSCADASVHDQADFRFREPELVLITVAAEFPYTAPVAEVTNPAFATLPNVMWGRYLCLYLSDNDWQPDAGMWGFVDRLITWFLRAAANSLTAPALRWHPPTMNALTTYPGMVVFRVDLPRGGEATVSLWRAWAALARIKHGVYEVDRWLRSPDDRGAGDGAPTTAVAPFIALPNPIGFRFPQTIGALVELLIAQGLPDTHVHALLEVASRVDQPAAKQDDGELGPVVLIGSPAAAGEAAPGRVAHIVGWRVPADAIAGIRAGDALRTSSPVMWVPVDDQRPSATLRRDHSRPARWLAGRRILLLGCGALGAPIAEHCVRAGASAITMVDNGVVTPGLLVRQPYEYLDIGVPKVAALARRLQRTDPSVKVDVDGDALPVVLDQWPEVDLVIDATANRTVAVAIERTRQNLDQPPPLLSVFVGHEANRGVATLALPHARGAGVDILRRLALEAAGEDYLADFLDDFFPDPPRTSFFQPAPGCSDPTFVGSSADLSVLASQLLNAGTMLLAEAGRQDAGPAPSRSATIVRLPSLQHPSGTTHRRQWLDDIIYTAEATSRTGRLQVRVDRAAMAVIRHSVADAAEADVDPYERGGALLGQIDTAAGVVWVSDALDLTPEGRSSQTQVSFDFRHAETLIAERRRSTRDMVRLIGAWHSHPMGAALPSHRDIETMTRMINAPTDGLLTRALLMIVTPGENWAVDRRLQVYAQMFS